MFSGEEKLLFGCQENKRKEEKAEQGNQSYQDIDHLLAETSEHLYALKVAEVVSS